jgi:predicted Zn-dependent peptidase
MRGKWNSLDQWEKMLEGVKIEDLRDLAKKYWIGKPVSSVWILPQTMITEVEKGK